MWSATARSCATNCWSFFTFRLTRCHHTYNTQADGFIYGELVIALDRKGRQHMFKLREGQQLHLSQGVLNHCDIIAVTPGGKLQTHTGSELRIRRPSLEEYVLQMKRGPTPAYPKDILAMIGMMDIGSGCQVLEAGSGSGALTLYLSRFGESDVCHMLEKQPL